LCCSSLIFLFCAVWRKIFRTSLSAAAAEGGQDHLLQAVFNFQSQIKSLEAVFDRGVLTALLNQELVALGFKHQPHLHSGSFDASHDLSSCDALTLTLTLNSFVKSSFIAPSSLYIDPSGAGSHRSTRAAAADVASAFALVSARALQSKLAAAALAADSDEASHVHARALRLMAPLSTPDSVRTAVGALEAPLAAPSLMRDVVRMCALACEAGQFMFLHNANACN
jgi:hypothetical protein